jgi:quinol monooxygenase YgiN
MIVVHVAYDYPAGKEAEMRALVPGVEDFSRGFDGCESFTLSFPGRLSGVLLGTEVWRDAATLNAHVAAAHDAPELDAWHALVTGMRPALYSAEPLSLEELRSARAAS